MTDPLQGRRKKLLYRASYRGFKEADLLIGGFARAHVSEMSEAELAELETLLTQNDRDLYEWATAKREAPEDVRGPVFEKLCAFRLSHD